MDFSISQYLGFSDIEVIEISSFEGFDVQEGYENSTEDNLEFNGSLNYSEQIVRY